MISASNNLKGNNVRKMYSLEKSSESIKLSERIMNHELLISSKIYQKFLSKTISMTLLVIPIICSLEKFRDNLIDFSLVNQFY